MGHNTMGDPSQNPEELSVPTNSHTSMAKAAKDFQPLFFLRVLASFSFQKKTVFFETQQMYT